MSGLTACSSRSAPEAAAPCSAPVVERASVQSVEWAVTSASVVTIDASGTRSARTVAEAETLQGSVAPAVGSASVEPSALLSAVAEKTDLDLGKAAGEVASDDMAVDPGHYVAYAGAKRTVVDYAGSCDQQPISGTLTGFQVDTQGVLDCATTPPADSLGHVARQWCPGA